jgi:subtilisin family serine protease
MAEIRINGVSFDPVQDAHALQVHGLLNTTDTANSDYILMQTAAPLTAAEKAELANAGVKLHDYVEGAYEGEYKDRDLDRLRALPFLTWVGEPPVKVKVSPELHAATQSSNAHLLSMLSPAGAPGGGKERVNIVLRRGVDDAAALDRIAAVAGVDRAGLDARNRTVRTVVDADRLDAIAGIDEVHHIEKDHAKQLWNNVARGILGAEIVATQTSFEGAGQIVAVCDTGFDNGDAADPHPAFEGRVRQLYALGRPGDASDHNGHGTHVCGSVLGNGHSQVYGPIRGCAPAATLIVQSIESADNTLGGLRDGVIPILQQAYDDGARVHSNSWGDTNNHYSADARDVDDFVWHNRDVVVVIAAGNAGRDGNRDGMVDSHSVGSPGTAKNCITVGASENNRPGFAYVDGDRRYSTYGECWPRQFPVKPVSTDTMAENPDGLVAFSSRGPTADGRIKPDVVAPGTAILSTRSRSSDAGSGWGLSDDDLYLFEGGTSMATPLVSGCAAVVREYLQQNGAQTPSAALVKACIINGAEPLRGQYTPSETGVVPNHQQGYGRVNLARSVDADGGSRLLRFWDEDRTLDTGDEQTFQVTLPKAAKSLKVTLVWTDPAGETLQNDLDLVVTAGGETGYGNAAPGSTIPDRVNNVEQVTLSAVPAGAVDIRVKAYRCAIEPQRFALVARAYY